MRAPTSLHTAKEDDWWLEELWARYCGSWSPPTGLRQEASRPPPPTSSSSPPSSSLGKPARTLVTLPSKASPSGAAVSGAAASTSSPSPPLGPLHARSAPVQVLWDTWLPYLLQLPLYESSEAAYLRSTEADDLPLSKAVDERDDEHDFRGLSHTRAPSSSSSPPPDKFTHYFFLPLRASSDPRRVVGRDGGVGSMPSPSSSSSASFFLSEEMLLSLRKQPDVLLPLLTFFYAWMLYQKGSDALRIDPETEKEHQGKAGGGGGGGKAGAAHESPLCSPVDGDVRVMGPQSVVFDPSLLLLLHNGEPAFSTDDGERKSGRSPHHPHYTEEEKKEWSASQKKRRKVEHLPSHSHSSSSSSPALLQRQRQQLAHHCRRIACEGLLYGVLVPLPSIPTPPSPSSSSPLLPRSPMTTSLLTSFSRVGASQLGQLVVLQGSVIRLPAPRLMCRRIVFVCSHCGAKKWCDTDDGVLAYPGACDGVGQADIVLDDPCAGEERNGSSSSASRARRTSCRGYRWQPHLPSAICEEVQRLKMQESVGDVEDVMESERMEDSSSGGGGRVNKVLEVDLREPFLNLVAVGDVVMVCGRLCTRKESGGGGNGWGGGGKQQKSTAGLQLCVHALSIAPYVKEKEWAYRGGGGSSPSFSASPSCIDASGVVGLSAQDAFQVDQYISLLLQPTDASVHSKSQRYHEATAAAASTTCRGMNEEENESESESSRPTVVGASVSTPTTISPHPFDADLTGGGFSMAERAQFFEAVRQPLWFRRLAASVAPGLFGLTMVKEAILLALLGGSDPRVMSSSSSTPSASSSGGGGMRQNMHLLLLGDPGVGKSQLLRAACQLASRSAYVCAHTSSSCGLTLTLSRDPVSGETTFEAGAVIHGDGGVTGIDEIDKGGAEHKALLEVMEQETVSVAKAGVVFSLPVQTSIFAAGNPIGGSFAASFSHTSTASLAECCRLSPALLSRFDVVVCLRDAPGQLCGEWPTTTTIPPMARSEGRAAAPFFSSWGKGRPTENGEEEEAQNGRCGSPFPSKAASSHRSLTQHVLGFHRLTRPAPEASQAKAAASSASDDRLTPLPTALVQRFLVFARATCHPRLLPEAGQALKAHYLAARAGGGGGMRDPTASDMPYSPSTTDTTISMRMSPSRQGAEEGRRITPRYLQSLIRLSCARAKAELRSEVTEVDAVYAIRLFQGCLSTLTPHAPSFAPSHTSFRASMGGGMGMGHPTMASAMPRGRGGKKKVMQEHVIQLLQARVMQNSWMAANNTTTGGDGDEKNNPHHHPTEEQAATWSPSSSPPNKFSRRLLMELCQEAGCTDFDAMLRQLNECGILLQAGEMYVFRGR